MRRAVLAALLVAGCKDAPPRQQPQPAALPDPADANVAALDWTACDLGVEAAAQAPAAARPSLLLASCQVCGGASFEPLVRWNTPTSDGGPKRASIEQAMDACAAYCVGDAKLKFLGTLDDARGKSSRTPWKQLAAICKERVSAIPDDRFIDGVYFALDRIGRAMAARGGDRAAQLAALDVPLPAISVTGQGPPLPANLPAVSDEIGDLQITVLGPTLTVGTLPRARLTADGVAVDLGSDGYPGRTVTAAELGAVLAGLTGGDKAKVVTLIAPHAMPAKNLVPVIVAAAKVATVRLGARAPSSPEGWDLPGTLPVSLDATPGGIRVTATMTVQELASQVARHAVAKTARIGISVP